MVMTKISTLFLTFQSRLVCHKNSDIGFKFLTFQSRLVCHKN